MTRRDPVTPRLRLAVLERDRECLAKRFDDGRCWGRLTIEHVKRDYRLGVRAESDLAHLVTLCEGHTENGRRAGRQWNTAKENRARMRAYLAERYPEVWA